MLTAQARSIRYLPPARFPHGTRQRIRVRGIQRERGMARMRYGRTTEEWLQALSYFGGTTLERLVDGAAARLGIRFDAARYKIYLPMASVITIIDRVIFNPLIAIYIDGWQHEARDEVRQKDFLKRLTLRQMGWRVVELGWRGLMNDPMREVQKVLYADW